MLLSAGACVVCVCARTLRIVSRDKILYLNFENTFIIIILTKSQIRIVLYFFIFLFILPVNC